MNECRLDFVPKLIIASKEQAWSLITWIKGEKPKTLNKEDVIEIATRIEAMNMNKEMQSALMLPVASEACKSLEYMLQNLGIRVERLKHVKPINDLDREVERWLSNFFGEFASSTINAAQTHTGESHWDEKNMCRIMSQSDVGIHNTIKTVSGISFVDFEYSGWDDLCKLFCDWILQPEYLFTADPIRRFSDELCHRKICKNDTWRKRYNDIIGIIKVKWITIMLRDYMNNTLSHKQWDKIKKYAQVEAKTLSID